MSIFLLYKIHPKSASSAAKVPSDPRRSNLIDIENQLSFVSARNRAIQQPPARISGLRLRFPALGLRLHFPAFRSTFAFNPAYHPVRILVFVPSSFGYRIRSIIVQVLHSFHYRSGTAFVPSSLWYCFVPTSLWYCFVPSSFGYCVCSSPTRLRPPELWSASQQNNKIQ